MKTNKYIYFLESSPVVLGAIFIRFSHLVHKLTGCPLIHI